MKKIICLALGAAVLFGGLGLSGCAKPRATRAQYAIRAEYSAETESLAAEMTVSVPNTSKVSLGELKFQLWANAYREGAKYKPVSELYAHSAYYYGSSYGEIEIRGITGAESFEICGEDENILAVKLASPLAPGKSAEISLTFETEIPRINHRMGVTRNTVNLANFYPALCYLAEDGYREYVYPPAGDPFVSETADYEIELTVPSDYTAVCGFSAEESEQDGKRTYHVCEKGVRDVAFVLGKNFTVHKQNAAGAEISYYSYADSAPEETLKCAAESLAFYAEKFSDYIFDTYAVVETDFVYGGMEYPAMSLVSSNLRQSERPAVVAHETAHQWWYSAVGSNQFECAWQDEGLAEYSTALFFEAHPDYGVTYSDFVGESERSYRAYFSIYSQTKGGANTAMNRPLTQFSGDYEYRNIAYDKGVILFDRVRETIGEKRFYAALKKYAETYRGEIATPEQLIGCFSKTGSKIAPVFLSFLEGKCVI